MTSGDPTVVIATVLLVTFLHELSHMLSCLSRARGFVTGVTKVFGVPMPVFGLIVPQPKTRDFLSPLFLVPCFLLLLNHIGVVSNGAAAVGTIANVAGGLPDIYMAVLNRRIPPSRVRGLLVLFRPPQIRLV